MEETKRKEVRGDAKSNERITEEEVTADKRRAQRRKERIGCEKRGKREVGIRKEVRGEERGCERRDQREEVRGKRR